VSGPHFAPTPPQNGEPLYLYVAATTQVVSVVIVVERTEEGHALPVQRPVYYVSEVLSETKTRNPQIQKLLYAVVLARRKLRHYFEAHPVSVVSSFPLGEIIHNPDAAGKIAKWSCNLWVRRSPTRRARRSSPRSWQTLTVGDEDGGRRGPALHLTPRGTHELGGTPTFPRVKQHGRV
jgi:hypothetical protein